MSEEQRVLDELGFMDIDAGDNIYVYHTKTSDVPLFYFYLRAAVGNFYIQCPNTPGAYIEENLEGVAEFICDYFNNRGLNLNDLSFSYFTRAYGLPELPNEGPTSKNFPAIKECTHPNAYMNVISASLSFKVCPDCKKELPDKPSVRDFIKACWDNENGLNNHLSRKK